MKNYIQNNEIICQHPNCYKISTYGLKDTNKPTWCHLHRTNDMIKFIHRWYRTCILSHILGKVK